MASEVFNLTGGRGPSSTDTMGATRADNTPSYTDADKAQDTANENAARNAFRSGDQQGAAAAVGNIKDGNRRITLYRELWGRKGPQVVPSSVFADGAGGVSDPLALFFMMIFYLDKQTTQFEWSKVLDIASSKGSQVFNDIKVDDSFLPQADSTQVNPYQKAKNDYSNAVQAQKKQVQTQVGEKKDAIKEQLGASSTGKQTAAYVQVWPIQNMPVINGGISKSVDWDAAKVKATTFAEPIISINGGAEHIEFDVEFTYAVGIAGVKGALAAPKDGAGFDQSQEDTWTAEEVMGMIYLACSLVYPFESAKLIGSEQDKEAKDKSPQFPVLFMRHYSLFPFLTPFVVKQVKIEPDENQPMLITEPLKLANVETHLRFPAVRQVVKITISLMSAHYYVTMFKESDGSEIQKQTSGKTFLALAKGLLDKKAN